MDKKFDIFISHASEDKDAIVRLEGVGCLKKE